MHVINSKHPFLMLSEKMYNKSSGMAAVCDEIPFVWKLGINIYTPYHCMRSN